MRLNPQQIETLINYLKRWKVPECSICQHDDWAVADTVFELTEHVGGTGSYGIGGPGGAGRSGRTVGDGIWPFTSGADHTLSIPQIFPVVPLTCKVCGNVLFVSAIAAGVIPRPTT